jgi:hypothetical protein
VREGRDGGGIVTAVPFLLEGTLVTVPKSQTIPEIISAFRFLEERMVHFEGLYGTEPKLKLFENKDNLH